MADVAHVGEVAHGQAVGKLPHRRRQHIFQAARRRFQAAPVAYAGNRPAQQALKTESEAV